MKKLPLLALCACLCLSSVCALAQPRYQTITDLREQTPARWTQTYEAHGRVINIDVPIRIPNVSSVPIVRVGFATDLQPYDENLYNDCSRNGEVLTRAESTKNSWFCDGSELPVGDADTQAENSPLTPSEARDCLMKLVSNYTAQTGELDLALQGQITWSRKYQKIKRGSAQVGIDMNTPISDTGCYQIKYHQLFHGIPYIVPGYYAVNAKGDDHQRPLGIVVGYVASENDYLLDFFPAIELGVLLEDVPLVSLENVISVFENWIDAGLIRDAYELRFGYMIYDDSDDFTHSFFLLPVWELRCIVTQTAKQETPQFDSAGLVRNQRMGSSSVVVNAQTGELLDLWEDRRSDRQMFSKVLTWDDVK